MAALLVVPGLLLGCATRPPVQMQTGFDGGAHAEYNIMGPNTVKGQGFLRQRGGGVVTCAGSPAYMLPATPFFMEIVAHLRAGKEPQVVSVGEGYKKLFRQTQCDAQGNFAFTGIPNGRWLVLTEVTWHVGYSSQGGTLKKEVEVLGGRTMLDPGATIQVLLTDADLIGR